MELSTSDTLIELSTAPLDVSALSRWVTVPNCGAVVTFCGCVRDHSPGREGVVSLEYEAYEEFATRRMRAVADAARQSWPDLARVAIMHRIGTLVVSEVAVVVAVSSPHRDTAFEAAKFCIDTVKVSVPLWKKERWSGGHEWTDCSHEGIASTQRVDEGEPEGKTRPGPDSSFT